MSFNIHGKTYLLILLSALSHISNGQSLCDGSAFFTLPNGPNTALYRFNNNDLAFEPVVTDLIYINAIGFNPEDNTIYGFSYGAAQGGQLIRLTPDGQTITSLGPVQGVTPGGLWAGCFSPSGIYYLSGNATQIYQIDVSGAVPTLIGEATKFYINNSGTGNPSFGDIVADPITGTLYGFDDNLKKLASINPATGAVDAFGFLQEAIPGSGGMFADAHGELFAFVFGELYQVDKVTGEFTFLYDAPTNNGGIDACNCPYYVDLVKNSSTNRACPGDTISYTFTITNTSQNVLNGLTFIDNLAASLIIIDEPDNLLGGSIEPNSGIGFNHITINNMTIPEGVSSFQLQVKLPDAMSQVTTLSGQAKIIGFPDYLPSVLWSDDEDTPAIDDPTSVLLLSSGCTAELYIPNAFSPNGDGINDVFLAYGLEVTAFSLRIFGRWGEELFYSNSITNGWDGFFLGEPMGTGVYLYSLEASFLNGEIIRKSGDISLLR